MTLRNKEVAKFCNKITTLQSQHRELKLAIHNKKNEASLENELVTQFGLAISVLWESFLHEIIIAYVAMNPRRALFSTKERVMKSVTEKFGAAVCKNIQFKTSGMSRNKILSFLDQKGLNITATTAKKLSDKANELLVTPFAMKFAFSSEDSELYDYIICLRNFLAHNSKGARTNLRDSINNLKEAKNLPLKANPSPITVYLKNPVTTDLTRVEYLAERLKQIAGTL